MTTEKPYDAFISHASEDKEDFVRPLANVLTELGAKIWYDEFTLQIGRSLSRSIDKGLTSSQFGIIVLSKQFFAKDWTEYELKSLNAKELGRDDVILPIWHGVTREDVLQYSPYLADKLAVISSKYSVEEIALKITDVIRPDLSENYHKRKAWMAIGSEKGEVKKMKVSDISPEVLFRHKSLPDSLLIRIRLIRAALITCYPHTYDFWVDGFKCDLHPEREIEYWEAIASCYLEAILMLGIKNSFFNEAFTIVFAQFNGGLEKKKEKELKLDKKTIADIKLLCKYKQPIYEFKMTEDKFGKEKHTLDIYGDLASNKK